eukprot:CAMPEP_0175060748 /NCGR_PEP_ID=MMETSP0052_2-20121109/13202_1 /TAXON_ID=51329 ORGANISM="Polytomella parva, Strain SAG 63-3" /NCGR_SAMPLE_ID=MMETSP0052_2 /ASSEMBLY_ACC=CAM_ASM_000194 /LENGTH=143 /DNA_ID=CAMNT_0016326527 /DNA_START=103 /DNA_END=530 /DNA_ORIENTATION=-
MATATEQSSGKPLWMLILFDPLSGTPLSLPIFFPTGHMEEEEKGREEEENREENREENGEKEEESSDVEKKRDEKKRDEKERDGEIKAEMEEEEEEEEKRGKREEEQDIRDRVARETVSDGTVDTNPHMSFCLLNAPPLPSPT